MEIPIVYEGVIITRRWVDFVIEQGADQLILETKASSQIRPEDVEQCLLYLHQGRYRLCFLMNFGERLLKVRRFVQSLAATAPGQVQDNE